MTSRPTFGSGERGHLGDAAAALVDGVLSHSARDLALAHIAHCGACRDEVDQQRALKARLSSLGGAHLAVPTELLASVMAIGAGTPAPVPAATPIRLTPPAYLPYRKVRVATAAGLGVAAAAGLLVALGSSNDEPGVPVQPQLATFVTQHAATTGEVPLTDPGFSAVTAGFVTH